MFWDKRGWGYLLFLEAEAMNAFEFNSVWKHIFSYIYYDNQVKYTMDPAYLKFIAAILTVYQYFLGKKIWVKKIFG